MDIPSWDEYFLQICNVVKLRSKDHKRQVGAVLVSNDNKIISTGYNGLKTRSDDNINWNDRELIHLLVLHAETNCLLHATSKFENTTLYLTLSPCANCIKLIASSGVKKIIFQEKYKDFDIVKGICQFYNIALIQFEDKQSGYIKISDSEDSDEGEENTESNWKYT